MTIDNYTLLIPTYNRPELLSSLLNYLNRKKVLFRVAVLDSSASDCQKINSALFQQLPDNFEHRSFSNDIGVFEKFSQGINSVKTDYFSFCADDDLVVIDALETCVNFLTQNNDYATAHGLYFNLISDDKHITINGITYSSSSINQDKPLHRLIEYARNYEAIVYAVHRTYSAVSAFDEAKNLKDIMGQELLSGALTIIDGKSARLPIFYYGRNNIRYLEYTNIHPTEYFVSKPNDLFSLYKDYKNTIMKRLEVTDNQSENMIDLAHFYYLLNYINPEIINYILAEKLKSTSDESIIKNVWPLLYKNKFNSFYNKLASIDLLRKFKKKYLRNFRSYSFIRKMIGKNDLIFSSNQRDRSYIVFRDVLNSRAENKTTFTKNDIQKLINEIDDYG